MASLFRRGGAELAKVIQQTGDPAAITGVAQLYSKAVAGAAELFMRSGLAAATISQVAGLAAPLTTGSVLFANLSGQLAQDNANFFWDDTTNALSLSGGSGAAVSAANKGRIIYNEVTQRFQASLNTSAYFDIGTLSGSLTTGSVVFANSLGQLAQDNANLFWDDTNNRLGIGIAAPVSPLHVVQPNAASVIGRFRATQTNSYCGLEYMSDADALQMGVGYANATVGLTHLRQKSYVYSPLVNFVLANNELNMFEFGTIGGGSAAAFIDMASGQASAATAALNRARFRYNNSTGKMQVSMSTGAFVDFTTAPASTSFTNGSVIFASGGNFIQDNANLFYDDAGDRLSLGSASPMGYRVSIISRTGENCIGVRGLNTSSYAGIDLIDSTITQRGAIGAGGSAVGNTLASRNFLLSVTNQDWIITDATTVWLRWYCTTNSFGQEMANGSGAAASLANTGKLIYNTTGQKFQASFNTAGYFDVATYAAALTTGSIVFANASNQLAQDNANLFWDDTNNRLGVNDNTPSEAIDVTGSINMTVSLFRGGTKVVGAQGAAVADAAGGATIDAEARTAINDLLARLRAATGHGLIA